MLYYRLEIFLFIFYYINFTEATVSTPYTEPTIKFGHFADGEKYMLDILNNKIPKKRPKLLMFTAPYKICDKGCSKEKMVMAFPLYIGRSAKKYYKKDFMQDYEKIHSKQPNAPFRPKSTREKWILTTRYIPPVIEIYDGTRSTLVVPQRPKNFYKVKKKAAKKSKPAKNVSKLSRSEDSRSQRSKSDEMNPQKLKSDESRSQKSQSNERRPEKLKSNELRPEKLVSKERRPEKFKSNELPPEIFKSTELRPENLNSKERSPETFKPNEKRPQKSSKCRPVDPNICYKKKYKPVKLRGYYRTETEEFL